MFFMHDWHTDHRFKKNTDVFKDINQRRIFMKLLLKNALLVLLTVFLPGQLWASEAASTSHTLGYTSSFIGIFCVIFFIVAYLFVMTEEFSHLRKSKPACVP